MFGHASLPARNYLYPASAPLEGHNAALEQLYLAHRYRNKLCELERGPRDLKPGEYPGRRARVQTTIDTMEPRLVSFTAELDQATAEVDRLLAEKKRKNAASRKQEKDPALKQQLAEARLRVKEIRERIKDLKQATFARSDVREALQAVEEENAELRRAARKASRLYSSTYMTVEADAGSMRSGAPPEFTRYEGEGRLTVRSQQGLSWADIESGNSTVLQLLPPQPTPHTRNTRWSQPHHTNWHVLRFRVGSDAGAKPIWCTVRINVNDKQTPPPTAKIKWAYLIRRVIGGEKLAGGKLSGRTLDNGKLERVDRQRYVHAGRVEWSVMFSLTDATGWAKSDTAGGGVCAINTGFRSVPGGLRVATVAGDDGWEQSFLLPEDRIDRVAKARSIQGYRDVNFDAIRGTLLAFRQSDRPRPDWWQEETESLHQFRSKSRLAALIVTWRSDRFAGDEEIFALAEAWRKRDSHLGRYAQGIMDGFSHGRQHLYRNWAAQLRRRYHTIVIGQTGLKDLAAKQEEDDPGSSLRDMARLAAGSYLLQYLREGFAEVVDGAAIFKALCTPGANLATLREEHARLVAATQVCHACGQRNHYDAAPAVNHTCQHCGETWDQDVNHCRNLLQWYSSQLAVSS